jgi:disulfide oxidoreductase YuzD
MINEEAKEIKEEIEAKAIETTETTEQVDSPVSEAPEASEPTQEIISEPVQEITEPVEEVISESKLEVTEPVEELAPVEEVTPELVSEPTEEKPAPISEPAAEISTPVEITSESTTANEIVAQIEAEPVEIQTVDYSNYSKQDFVAALEKVMADVKENPSVGTFRRSEDTLKEVRPLFEQIKATEKAEALAKFKEANEDSEEGFDYKFDADVEQFDKLFKGLKDERSKYFQSIEKEKDKNFNQKTELINRLRTLVEGEDSSDPAHIKTGFNDFKKIQDEWKAAGNVNSPHNNTLWQTFHALVDRFYSNRSIYFELLELDRKRNLQQKIELCTKIEKISEAAKTEPVTGKMLDEAVAAFEEYKHVGPAPKEENELIWQRVKDALDVIYGKRREQGEASKAEAEQVFALKLAIAELIEPFATFNSTTITEWNDRTKTLLALQDQWNAIKGFMPKEKGKELSDKFWADIKTFFRNKTEFFKVLESKRDENLVAKTAIIAEVEALLESGDESQEATNTVIRLQKEFRDIGHVPEKDKDSIYEKFKTACDAFFNAKRAKNQHVEKDFEANLEKKTALCDTIEAESVEGANTARLAEFKAEWSAIGFVPKKDMQTIGKRYINAINKYVSAMGKLSSKEKEQLTMTDSPRPPRGDRPERSGGGRNDRNNDRNDRGGNRDYNSNRGDYSSNNAGGGNSDARRKIQTLENDIATYRNNLEFFAKSKNADKFRQDVEAKIQSAEKEIAKLKEQAK